MPGRRGEHTALRRYRAVELRLGGMSYRAIARESGWRSSNAAFKAVATGIREWLTEPLEEQRRLELLRLDALQRAWWDKALIGGVAAAALVLKVHDRRARLLGLEAPARVDLTAWVRQVAEEEGLDPDQAVRDAECIVKWVGW